MLAMKEINPCIESGCPGLCCQNTALEITKFERTRLFPNAIKVNSLETLATLKKEKVLGVFYTRYRRKNLTQNGFVVLSINGPCPNRTVEGGCSKHEEREHAARNFTIGSPGCNEIRKENGLSPIIR